MKYIDLFYYVGYWNQNRNEHKGSVVSFSLLAFLFTGIQAYVTLTFMNIVDIIHGKEINFFYLFSYIQFVFALLILNHLYIYTGNRKNKIIKRFSHLSDDDLKKYLRYFVYFMVVSLLVFGITANLRGRVLGLI